MSDDTEGPSGPAEGFRVVCLDMAGTTISDNGAVLDAFEAGLEAAGMGRNHPDRAEAMNYVAETMGQSKLEVFTHVLGDRARAETALDGFERRWGELLAAGVISALPGAESAVTGLRRAGFRVALLTGFSASVRDSILDALGWRQLADLSLCPAEAGRGRPWPDLVLKAALVLQAGSMADVAVVGDTPSDMVSGRRSGAGLVIGVLSGSGTRDELAAAGADQVVATVVEAARLIDGSA